MSDSSKVLLPALAVTTDQITQLRQEFDSIHKKLAVKEVNKLQEENGRERAAAERDAALAQVVQLQSDVRDLQQEVQRLTSSHKLEVDKMQFEMQQQAAQRSEQLSALSGERDQLRLELEQFHMRDSSATRILRLEQECAGRNAELAEVGQQIQRLDERVKEGKVMMKHAKVLLGQAAQTTAAERQQRDRLAQELAQLKHQFAQFTTGKRREADSVRHAALLRDENERLQRLLLQVSHMLSNSNCLTCVSFACCSKRKRWNSIRASDNWFSGKKSRSKRWPPCSISCVRTSSCKHFTFRKGNRFPV